MSVQNALLTGKVALITGASSGIGAAAARVFAAEGAAVVLAARREQQLADLVDELTGKGLEACYAVTDVTSDADVARAVQTAVSRYGRLDAAFNNAGYGAEQTPLHLMEQEVFDRIIDVNLRGVWSCMRHEIPAMLAAGGGAIVNTSSVAGLVATPVAAPYVVSKHAVVGLTRAAANEYGAQGIRVNAVAPGTTRSEMIEQWLAIRPDIEARLHEATPQPRTAAPEEIAEAAAWLCSERSSFVTGAVLPVDGGYTVR
ncbi:glucose 1-dehydrogenase [Streptomyces sp. NRRL B-24484]|uniref:glucose 1-dehydrogenase n=1 Tax=Streptomyces sp. NRRL B-24484 TaxID=1463833 RepID=UPI0004C0CEF5|nr:glucose 1-dehydrogenase [Streptomyces sp. NRRL B-24484]